MSERKIKLSEINEVKEFVSTAGKCDFDIDVFYNRRAKLRPDTCTYCKIRRRRYAVRECIK